MYEQQKNKKYPVSLRFDCRKMESSAIEELAEKLMLYLSVQVIGGNIIYATGKVTHFEYQQIWDITDKYDVILD